MATKTKDYVATLSSDYSKQNPISVSKKTALIVDGITNKDDVSNLKFSIVKEGTSSYLLVTNSDLTKGIKLSNYSSIKYIKTDIVSSKKYELTDIIANSLVDNTANIISSYNKKKLTATGTTNYNDKIDMSLSDYAPTGATNIKKNRGLAINGGNGDDEITGTTYNDTITGGKGENTIIYDSEDFGHDVIKLTKGETLYINFEDELSGATLSYGKGVNKNDLLVQVDEENSITLKNYLLKNTGATVYINGEDISKNAALDPIEEDYFLKDDGKLKTSKYTGTALADVIDASGVYVASKTKKDRAGNIISQTGLTLNTGLGDDRITGTLFNDTITGGLGENTIVVKNKEFGTDTVNLTKGEKLTLDLTDYNWTEFNFEIQKNDLLVKTGNGTVVLKNFAKSNVVGVDGYVKVFLSGDKTLNLNEDNIFNYTNTSERFVFGKNNVLTFTGTRFGETIDTTEITKPVTIKAGAGVNTIVVDDSNSFDIIVAEEKLNAKNIIKFKNNIDAGYTFTKHGNDLIISKGTNSKITINGYFIERDDKTKYADIKFVVNESDTTIDTLLNGKTLFVEGSGKIYGTDYSDNITGSNGNDTIYGEKGNDIINAGGGSDTLYFNVGDGNDIVENVIGTKTLVFQGVNNINDINVEYNDDGDLVCSYGNTDSVTIKDYFSGTLKFKVGNVTKNLSYFFPEPTPISTDTEFMVADANLVEGTDNPDKVTVTSDNINRIFAKDGNDEIITGSGYNYVYGGKGNDTITSGTGKDIIFGGGGENTIYITAGSGADQIEGEGEHNTIVFSDLDSLDDLKFTMGEQNAYMYISDLYISGYGNDTDSVKITSFFNLEGYDYSKYIVKDKNGNSDTLYNLLSKSDIKNKYFTGTYKARHNAVTTSPAQRTTQIDSVIYGNTPGIANHNVIVGAGGNNTYYSGGFNTGAAGSGMYGYTMIYGGDGDETFHAEGDRIYFNGETITNTNSVYVVTKNDGTKEVKQGLFYRTPIADEAPYMAQLDVYGEHDNIYYTEDPDKIAILLADTETYGIQGVGLVGDGTNGIVKLDVITSYTHVLSGGDGNDTFYTSSGGEGGAGNDIFYGSGEMQGGQGDDKFIFKEDYELNKADTWYGASTNSGNDFIDTTKITTVLNNPISIRFGEGVNTIKVDGKNNVNIFVDTTSTYEEENTEMFIETKDLGTDSNVHFTAFEKDGKLYIASNNGRGAGTLIIDGWGELSDEQKDKITITYKESHEWVYKERSTYKLSEFLDVINQTGKLFEGEGYTNGAHKYDMGEGLTVRKKETYTFNVIDNSNGTLSTINENGTTVTADRNVYNDNQEITGTTNKIVDYYIIGGTGSQTIKGGDGNDVIYGDNINGHDKEGNYVSSTKNDGADTIYGGKGNDYIIGGAGNDRINGGSGKDYIDGGDGDDTLIGGTVDVEDLDNTQFNYKELHGGAGNDIIYSTEETKAYAGGDKYFRNNIYGEDGDDKIYANGYNDVVYGGVGDDEIHSYKNKQNGYYNSNASSLIYGGKGNDRIYLYGNAEQTGVYAVQEVYGEEGDDLIDASGSSSHNKIDGGAGSDTIYAGSGGDSISGGYGDDIIYGGDGDDDLYGGDGLSDSDIIYGGKGNDTISALGSSKIYGEEGNDTIYFATGKLLAPSNLYIDGGAGDDTYVTDQSGYGYDTIVASAGKDTIRIADFDYQSERFGKSSYTYNGYDLVLTLNHMGYMSGLILKDYKKGGFENFSVVTTSDAGATVMTGKYTITQFLDYLDGKDIYVSNGTNGNDMIRSTGNIDGKGGDDIIIANSSASTEEAPQIVITGSGDNAVVLNADYTDVAGGTGNDSYTMVGTNSTIVDADGNNNVVRTSSDGGTYNITFNGGGNNTVTDNTFNWANYNINSTGNGKLTVNISEYAQAKVTAKSGSADDEFNVGIGDVNIDAGEGNNKITFVTGSAKAGSGDDIYTVNYKYATQVFIEDTLGVNTLTINDKTDHGEGTGATPPVTHSDYNIFFNVDKYGNGKNFYVDAEVTNPEQQQNGDWLSVDYQLNVDDVGYGVIITTSRISYDDVVLAFGSWYFSGDDNAPHWIKGDTAGIRMTGETLNSFSQINIDDGYSLNITKENMDAIRQSIANWLTSDGRDYADVQAACSVEDTSLAQANFVAITGVINDNLNWIQNA